MAWKQRWKPRDSSVQSLCRHFGGSGIEGEIPDVLKKLVNPPRNSRRRSKAVSEGCITAFATAGFSAGTETMNYQGFSTNS
jgi:hypothetical protein